MRSFLALVAATLAVCGFAPGASGAELILKSRTVAPGGQVSVPFFVDAVSRDNLWGIEFAIVTDRLHLYVADPANSFVPFNRQTQDFAFSADPTIAEGETSARPTLYVAYVRWGGYQVQTNPESVTALGSMKFNACSSALWSDEYDLGIYNYYHRPYEPGLKRLRPGAIGATSTLTREVGAVSEPITVCSVMPSRFAPPKLNETDPDPLPVPLGKIVVGKPGDVNNDGVINLKDYALLYRAWKFPDTATTRIKVVGDIAPLNGYTLGNPGGTRGVGYGDGFIDGRDLVALGDFINRDRTMNGNESVVFPVSE